MPYKAEIIKYLSDHKIPKDEGTYPEEMIAHIAIKAFEELAERIKDLVSDLGEADEELSMCETKLEDANYKLSEIKKTCDGTS